MEKYNCAYSSSSSPPSLDLSIAMLHGFSASSASLIPSSGESGTGSSMKELDINQVPSEEEEEEDEDESPKGSGRAPRKKLRLTKDQSRLLEESFTLNHSLNPKEKDILAEQLRLKPRQVEVWFQNRRARSKLKHTEMECEYLKRWFGSLTEQNRRLQKEVENLRAVHHHSPPPSALTMCPRCERITASSTTAKSHQTSAAWYN